MMIDESLVVKASLSRREASAGKVQITSFFSVIFDVT